MHSTVKAVTWILGIVLTLVGILGFFSDPILGIFETDMIHNVIHLLSGVIAMGAAASGESYSRLYLIVFGLVYGVVTVVGFVQATTVLGLITVNAADNYLHAAISLLSLGIGFGTGKAQAPTGQIKPM